MEKTKKEEKINLRIRQKKLLKKIAENIRSEKPKSLSLLCRESGYPISTSGHPGRIMRTQSFQQALRRAGLDENTIISEYQKAIKEKPKQKITWDVKRKFLEDIVKFLDLAPKEEGGKWQKIQAYIERFLTIKISPEQFRGLKEKKEKGEEISEGFRNIDWDSIEEGEIKEE